MTPRSGIITHSPLAMATTEGPKHMLLAANLAFCALQGKEAVDIIGRPISEAIGEVEAASVVELLDRLYGGESSGFVSNVHDIDEERQVKYRSYTAWGLPVVDGQTDGLVVQVADFAEEKLEDGRLDTATAEILELNAEMAEINEQLVITAVNQHTLAERAAAAEGRMLSVINGLNAMICEIDAVTGKFTFLSETSNLFLGYSIEQWASNGFWRQIIEPTDYDAAQSGFSMVGVVGDAYQHAFRVTAENGSVVWLRNVMKAVRNADGTVVKRRCIFVDVTEQQFAHLAMVKDLDRNRNIADALQFSLVWQNFEKSFYNLDVAVSYEPALDEALVGGDFFDAFILPNKSVLLFVGDVTGKGLKAASRTAEIIYALRAFAQNYKSATDMITQLNEFICDYHMVEDHKPNLFVALSLVVVDPITGQAQVTSAGAEPALILRASGEMVEVPAGGLTLGIDYDSTYETVDLILEDDDLLIMTTDGIIDARDGSNFFGATGVLNATLAANATDKLVDIGSAVLEAARAYGGGGFRDDACLLLARLDRILPPETF